MKKQLWEDLDKFTREMQPPVNVKNCSVVLFTGKAAILCDSIRFQLIPCDSIRFRVILGLAVSAEGSEGHVIYHANPDLAGKPWYDDLLLVDDFEDDGITPKVMHAGRLRCLVQLTLPNGEIKILCYVHAFRGAKRKQHHGRGGRIESTYEYDIAAPESRWCDEVPYACMRFAYGTRNKPIMWLLDTEIISSGVWVQESFDREGEFIFIRHN